MLIYLKVDNRTNHTRSSSKSPCINCNLQLLRVCIISLYIKTMNKCIIIINTPWSNYNTAIFILSKRIETNKQKQEYKDWTLHKEFLTYTNLTIILRISSLSSYLLVFKSPQPAPSHR